MKLRHSIPVALLLATWPGFAAAGQFAPHRALYDMTLRSTERDSGIVSVQGEMLVEWGETCEGWTLVHRSAFDIGVGGEETTRIVSNVTTWESRDGLQYRFSVRNLENDGEDERIEGSARLNGVGQEGIVRYEKPEARNMKLPAGTIFPTAHSEEVLAKAGAKPVSFQRTVFDGLSGEGLFEVSAVVGAALPLTPPVGKVLQPLAGLRSWQTQIAFYEFGSSDSTPDNEIAFRMYENGVGDELTIDFGRFKVLARLKALELTPRPSCRADGAPDGGAAPRR